MSISSAAENLMNLIKLVPQLEGRVGLTIGGKEGDPQMYKVTVPAAWIVYEGDQNTSSNEDGECAVMARASFVVQVILEYTTNNNMLTVQLPVLDEIITNVAGQGGEYLWKYEGQAIRNLDPKRMVYAQRYTTNLTITA